MELALEIIIFLLAAGLFVASLLIFRRIRHKTFYPVIWIPLFVNLPFWLFEGLEFVAKLKARGFTSSPECLGEMFSPIMLFLLFAPAVPLFVAVLCVSPALGTWKIKPVVVSLLVALVGLACAYGLTREIGDFLRLN